MKITVYLLIFIACSLCLTSPASAVSSKNRPNIVLIIGDDIGFTDLGSYGGEINTPNLDSIASQGVRFSNFHTTASCSPTRSMLMTGVDNHYNGLGNMLITMPFEHVGAPGYEGSLNQKVVTVAQLLKDNGYHTYLTGKWHLGNSPQERAINRGFERTISLGETGADNWEQRHYLPFAGQPQWFQDGSPHTLPDDFYSSEYYIDKAIEFINSNIADQRPFFSYIGFQAAHIPIQAPEEFIAKYEGVYDVGWDKIREQRARKAIQTKLVPISSRTETMQTTSNWERLKPKEKAYQIKRMAVYAGMIEAMDHHIGRLIDHLKNIGEFDNTVFVFLSDNGPEPSDSTTVEPLSTWVKLNYSTDIDDLGSKGAYSSIGESWASAAASPGKDYNFFAGEGGVRVPLIIAGPSIKGNGRIEHSFTFIKDIAPTLLELSNTLVHNGSYAGKKVHPITGKSTLPVLQLKATKTHTKETPIGYELAGNAALYKGDHKLLRNLPPMGDGKWHLYNIAVDPGETKDLRLEFESLFEEMLIDYKLYESQHNVLTMPEGYNYVEQITRNTMRRLVSKLAPYSALLITFIIGLIWFRRKRKQDIVK